VAEPTALQQIVDHFHHNIPHARELGMEVVSATVERTQVRLPFRPEFLGDTERQLIHPGVVTTLIDSTCGVALMAHLSRQVTIATLDLRVDYLRPSRPGTGLICSAECYRLTGQIAFMRAFVWQDDPASPVAASVSTFMLNSGGPPAPAVPEAAP
jgi:uncharacterized protein (TIGR00369 family)